MWASCCAIAAKVLHFQGAGLVAKLQTLVSSRPRQLHINLTLLQECTAFMHRRLSVQRVLNWHARSKCAVLMCIVLQDCLQALQVVSVAFYLQMRCAVVHRAAGRHTA
jgi:hypothetical protein